MKYATIKKIFLMESMEIKKLPTSSKQSLQKTSFQDWQEKIAQKINDVIFSTPNESFQNEQIDNFMWLEIWENNYDNRGEIENNLVYNLPNLACFLYQTFPNQSDELILSVLKAYQKQSGLNFLGINWENKKNIPEKFKTYVQKHPLDEKYILYLLGKQFTFKRYLWAKQSEQKEELLKKYNQKIKSLFHHPLFRKKLEEKIDTLLHINETEFLRKYINASFEKISELENISDRDWVNFLVNEAQKDKKEFENALKRKKRKLKTTTQKADRASLEEDIEIISEELQKIKSDILLWNIPKEHLSTDITPIIQKHEIETYNKELEQKRRINDNLWIWHLEEEIIHNIMKQLSRYYIEKSENDKENALLKNFFANKSLTCFSGAWAFAAMLIKSWFSQDDIFIVNSFVWGNNYNHAFLVIRKNDGSYIKVDYGLKEIVPITPTKEVEKSLMFILNLWYTSAGYSKNNKIEWLDTKGRLYKLTDGIIVMYLMNLAHSYIEQNKLEEAFQYLNIVAWIDDKNCDLNEALWIYFEKKWEREKAFQHFSISRTIVSDYYISRYHFDKKDYKKAEWWFDYFIKTARDARWIDKKMITSAVQYLAKIRKKNKQWKIEGYGMWIEKQRTFLIDLYNHYIHREHDDYEKKMQEYILLDETDRKRILSMLNNYANGFKHTQPAEIIMDLVRRERLANTKLYQRLNMWEFKLNV